MREELEKIREMLKKILIPEVDKKEDENDVLGIKENDDKQREDNI